MQKYEHAFGKNDIRGIYGDDITEELFYNTGRGFVEYLKAKSLKNPSEMWITVTRDARLHSPSLAKSLIDGITSTGANVVDLGLAPTPIGYYSEVVGVNKDITQGHDIIAAAIITASHNPKEYNGLKMTYNKCTLTENQIKEVKELTFNEFNKAEKAAVSGVVKTYNLIPDYINEMKERFMGLCDGVKVVVDSANATGGVVGPQLYKELGCEVIELFSEPDGNFPNHHPNPSVEKTLDTLKETVVKNHADVGIAYDGDSDRIGIVDNQGNFLTGDKLLLIYAQDLIEKCKPEGVVPTVVSEVKCSQVLYDTIDNIGGHSVMCKTGHGYIKDKMKETGAILAGEMSGHTFFKDRYYGFDDAIYAGCRILEIISKHKKADSTFTIQKLLKPFDEVYSSSEVRYPCPNELKKSTLAKVQEIIENDMNIFGSPIKDIITLDGMRIVFDGGFALIRQSNTEPVFTLRFEAHNKQECEKFKDAMISMLDRILEKTAK
ncbi:phosphomannomutase/phosphoglucomutase [bacterium]|nr:phosphomannomutase/phosphoglucomutase [bacterium]